MILIIKYLCIPSSSSCNARIKCVFTCDTIIFLSSWCNRAVHYILDEALYIMYRCDRFMCFTPCLAAFISFLVALASYKDSLFTRIRTYSADALHTTDYQIRTAWQIDQSSAKSWWTTCNWNNYAITTLSMVLAATRIR